MRLPSSAAAAIAGADRSLDSRYAWFRLGAALLLMSLGGVGMYSVVVALPAVQAEFGVARGSASLPFALTMIGFGIGGILMGRLADRFGVVLPVVIGASALGAGYVAAGWTTSLWQFALVQGGLIGLLGTSATFGPLIADISLWFRGRRGIAVAICASGNYLAGAIWPPIVQHFIEAAGWRATYQGIGLVCMVLMIPIALLAMRHRPPGLADGPGTSVPHPGFRSLDADRPLGMSPAGLQNLLGIAGVACCVAMSMPQVHIVAYCGDLGYGVARGAQMLSLMLAAGVVSRLASGWICDHIGGLRTLLLGSCLQCLALFLFLPFDSLGSLFVISILFGLFQGGIVPSYAIIVREYFSPLEAGRRVGTVLMATLFGMALGGWLSGAIFDWTGSYKAAFVNGIGWNLLNIAIAVALLMRPGSRRVAA